MRLGGIGLGRFSARQAAAALRRVRDDDLTYSHVGSTLDPGGREDSALHAEQIDVGQGSAAFQAARRAIRTWVPQQAIGADIWPSQAAVVPDQTILVVLRRGPFYVVAPGRVVAVVDEPSRFAYAYGTLPGHPERGEETFTVEQMDSGTVRVTVRVDARPATLAARAAAPLVLRMQRIALRRYLRAVADHVAADAGRRRQ